MDLTKLKATEDTDLERWLRFIQTEDQTVREELGRRNAVMQYANTVMNQFYADKKERLRYEAALRYESDRATLLEAGIDKGIRIGEQRGEKRGEQQGRLQTARKMKSNGLSFDMIMKCTGLTAEQIAKL